ncbi:MAG: hypothetical protein DSZ01_05895 [Gammaproteobacteria bacterium]|nr:MAG: hypothetical protein DSZ01_05895 [Gammaproteobacteria bacterium]
MDEQLKRRLIGATVLVSLAIIFLPMLLEHEPATLKPVPMKPIPEEPERNFDSSLLQDVPPRNPITELAAPADKTTATTPAPAPVKAQPVPEKTVVAKVAPKPAPRKASKVPAKPKKPALPKAAPSGWVVQVASLTSRENAMQLVRKLREAGLDTMDPRPVTVKGKRFYRVQVGPEISRANAEKHLTLIKRVAGTKGKVMRYP